VLYPEEMRSLVAITLLSIFSSVTLVAQDGEPRAGSLKTKVDPGRAGVFIDGKYVGSAANFHRARTFNLNAGEHEVVLVDPRYEELKTKVTIRAGQTVTLSEKLRKLPTPQGPFGRLRTVEFDKYAAVYLNGKFQGHADEISNFAQGLLIQPGEYALRVESMTGAPVHEEKVKIEAGKTTIVRR
jgi:hypothetical protein